MATLLHLIQRLGRAARTLWSIVGLTLLLVVLVEAGLRTAFAIRDRVAAPQIPDPRVIAEGYGGETWPIQHYRELERLEERWQPYVYFRQRPLAGETIAIDSDGHRSTWQPPAVADVPAEKRTHRILMLGGSSLWGYGARNDRTIPSLVARKLHDARRRVEVRNLAEIGYVSTQEVVALVRELQAGYRPDLVIFYDGVNDSTSALLEGEAGVTTNERNRRAEFNLRQSPPRLAGTLVGRLVQESAFYRFAQLVGRRLIGNPTTGGVRMTSENQQVLASDVVSRYRANLEIVDELARGFRFETLYYWQPVIFDRDAPTAFEREETERFGWARAFLADVYRAVETSALHRSHRGFHDLSRIFDGTSDLVFIDYCHTTESANERIAEAIARDVIAALPPAEAVVRAGRATDGDVR